VLAIFFMGEQFPFGSCVFLPGAVVLDIIRNLWRHAVTQYKAEGAEPCDVFAPYEKDLAKHFMAHFPLGESRSADAALAASLRGMHQGRWPGQNYWPLAAIGLFARDERSF
jgi:hypothetical protein